MIGSRAVDVLGRLLELVSEHDNVAKTVYKRGSIHVVEKAWKRQAKIQRTTACWQWKLETSRDKQVYLEVAAELNRL